MTHEVIVVVDQDRHVLYVSPSVLRLTGYQPSEVVGGRLTVFFHPDDCDAVEDTYSQLLTSGSVRLPHRVVHKDGGEHWVECSGVDLTDDPDFGGFVVAMHDVTAAVEAQQAMVAFERRFRAAVEHADESIVIYDADMRPTYQSPGSIRHIGTLTGLFDSIRSHVLPDSADDAATGIAAAMARPGETIERLLHYRFRDGHLGWAHVLVTNLLDDPDVKGLVMNGREVTAQIQLQQRLRQEATHDSLTGLPNRALLLEHLAGAIASMAAGSTIAVLFLDLDRFKVVNDSYGHRTGDLVLRQLAARLDVSTGDGAFVARFGGDEFVVVQPMCTPEEATATAEAMARVSSEPFVVETSDHRETSTSEVFLSASVGIAIGAAPTMAETLLHDADTAMYRAKDHRRGGWELYDETMRKQAVSRLTLEAELARALDRQDFELYYQPVMDLGTGGVVSYEALVRWNHWERGAISPEEFIPVAEETGGIHRLGAWVFDTVCRQLRSWQLREGRRRVPVAVNLSPRQLSRPELADELVALFDETGISPSMMCLEITEGLVIEDPDLALSSLDKLHSIGVTLALDHFGTGWSSLTYLRSLPVDVIKVDRSFITGVGTSTDDDAIVGAVISMCHALGKIVVAEGVENPEQLVGLRRLGCDRAQGYLFAEPLLPHLLIPWLEDRAARI